MTPDVPLNQANPWSKPLGTAGLTIACATAILCIFLVPKDWVVPQTSILRPMYWYGISIGLILLFCSALPYWVPGLFLTGMLGVGLVLVSVRYGFIKIRGQVYAVRRGWTGYHDSDDSDADFDFDFDD
jgi:hypothetical protein